MRGYSPPYRSPPRRGYGGRGRSPPPRRGYGGGGGGGGYGGRKERGNGSLLVRNIPLSCRAEDLRVPFERFGPVRDVYLPKDYYSGEPRGFAFVEFVDPYDATQAQYHMNRQLFGGREITVVLAAESRKRPEEMHGRSRVRGYSGNEGRRSSHYGRSRSRSVSRSRSPRYRSRPRSRSYSPAPRRRDDYSASPRRRESRHTKSPRPQPKEHDDEKRRRPYSPDSRDGDHAPNNGYDKRRSPPADAEGSRPRFRSPRRSPSASPPGSRSRSADESPVHND